MDVVLPFPTYSHDLWILFRVNHGRAIEVHSHTRLLSIVFSIEMMTTRRLFVLAAAFALALPLSGQTPATSWQDLEAGNRQFITAGDSARALPMDVKDRMPGGQSPAITVLSCADSRVPPELIFDQTIGSLFVVR